MDYLAINKQAWDKHTPIHVDSTFYDVKAFVQGKSSLHPVDLVQVGDVKGKSLLHLQCHFGQDTLSWARLGAQVTGVDLSTAAINKAKALAEEINVPARFINEDVYRFGENNTTQFDIVYTSYGVLCWLPNLDKWADVIAKSLKPGGQFHLIEFHPFNDVLSGYRYFPAVEPDVEEEATYTENSTGEKSTIVTWPHSLSEVIMALIKAGISIDTFQEYDFSPYNCFDNLHFVEGKGYQMIFKGHGIPLTYAIKGTKV